ncbi:hypothetical protein M5K25_004911 [Dendrobium thyrsiflorum]|uniref:Uncharacterized protein n=1 Tax=Dendrobium thyrsiflorum TaxID=117978 RepID=A0ABD0VGI8_DENTH
MLNTFLLRPNLLQTYDFLDTSDLFSTKLENFFGFFIIACTVYHLWRERNNRSFSFSAQSTSAIVDAAILSIRGKTKNWKNVELLKQKFAGLF